jgi:hypothetical protein
MSGKSSHTSRLIHALVTDACAYVRQWQTIYVCVCVYIYIYIYKLLRHRCIAYAMWFSLTVLKNNMTYICPNFCCFATVLEKIYTPYLRNAELISVTRISYSCTMSSLKLQWRKPKHRDEGHCELLTWDETTNNFDVTTWNADGSKYLKI